ncbi:hypothetical protein SB00610_04128 [Klebsiella quasipneumoniae subsp. similipneumoniae]|nr:hypothetical protein SB00610_04128 [Klebsiella quasipneumoniae subsp. similipneumoniae]
MIIKPTSKKTGVPRIKATMVKAAIVRLEPSTPVSVFASDSAPPDISMSTPSIDPKIIMLAIWPSRPPIPFSMVVMILSAGMPVANATSRLTIRSATKGCAFALITSRSNSTTLANAISNSADVDIVLPRVLTGIQRVIFLVPRFIFSGRAKTIPVRKGYPPWGYIRSRSNRHSPLYPVTHRSMNN